MRRHQILTGTARIRESSAPSFAVKTTIALTPCCAIGTYYYDDKEYHSTLLNRLVREWLCLRCKSVAAPPSMTRLSVLNLIKSHDLSGRGNAESGARTHIPLPRLDGVGARDFAVPARTSSPARISTFGLV